jgi:hypothetical protein
MGIFCVIPNLDEIRKFIIPSKPELSAEQKAEFASAIAKVCGILTTADIITT